MSPEYTLTEDKRFHSVFLFPFVKASEHPKSTKGEDVCVATPLTADYLQIIIPMPAPTTVTAKVLQIHRGQNRAA